MAIAMLEAGIDWPDHAVRSPDAEALATILMPQTNLTVWERQHGPEVSIGALSGVVDIHLTLDVSQTRTALTDALAAAGYSPTLVTALAHDIAAHARRLADLLDRDAVVIRLEIIDTDACRRFHADYISVRLILTYCGPGTQWLDDDDAARLRDGAAIDSLTIRQISTGHAALFKGRDWAPDGAIVHRSPPIARSGSRRLVLVIDPAPGGSMQHD